MSSSQIMTFKLKNNHSTRASPKNSNVKKKKKIVRIDKIQFRFYEANRSQKQNHELIICENCSNFFYGQFAFASAFRSFYNLDQLALVADCIVRIDNEMLNSMFNW